MISIINHILDWTEVWALFIPISVLLLSKKPQPRIIIGYVFFALLLNVITDIIGDFKISLHLPWWLMSNTYFYNINSILRLFCFTFFFIQINPTRLQKVNKFSLFAFMIFFLINFIFFQNFFDLKIINTRLLAVETGILLLFCILYFIYQINNEVSIYTETGAFYIVTGLSIFIVICFPIYLFYEQLLNQDITFGIDVWQVHNIAFLIFCIFIAIGFTKKQLY